MTHSIEKATLKNSSLVMFKTVQMPTKSLNFSIGKSTRLLCAWLGVNEWTPELILVIFMVFGVGY